MAAGNERDWQDQPRAFGFGGYLSLSLPGSVATRCAVVLELVRVSSVYLFIYRRRRVLVLHSRQAKRLSSRCLPCWLGFLLRCCTYVAVTREVDPSPPSPVSASARRRRRENTQGGANHTVQCHWFWLPVSLSSSEGTSYRYPKFDTTGPFLSLGPGAGGGLSPSLSFTSENGTIHPNSSGVNQIQNWRTNGLF